MKKMFLLLPTLTVLLVFIGPVLCRAEEQAPSPRTEAWIVESKIREQIQKGLLPYPTKQELAVFEKDDHAFRSKRAELALDKALEDIAANIPFLLVLKKDFGESALFGWAVPIAEKLPSQPVAVIQFMTNIADDEQYIIHMCPMGVIEDSIPFDQYKIWLERSVAALEAFTMTDVKAEKMRNYCLQRIKHDLATGEPW